MTIAIEEKFTRCGPVLRYNPRSLYLPMIYGIVTNTARNEDFPTVERFLVDSGASISVLNSKYTDFFDKADRYDVQIVQYGGGQPVTLDVHKVRITIKGSTYTLVAAVDKEMAFEHSLLGHTDFFEQFRAIVLNTNDIKKQNFTTRLIRKS